MSAKPIKPRRMWSGDIIFPATDAITLYPSRREADRSDDSPARPVLVIDLSPESVEELAKQIATASIKKLGVSQKTFDGLMPHILKLAKEDLAAIGIRPTKGRK